MAKLEAMVESIKACKNVEDIHGIVNKILEYLNELKRKRRK